VATNQAVARSNRARRANFVRACSLAAANLPTHFRQFSDTFLLLPFYHCQGGRLRAPTIGYLLRGIHQFAEFGCRVVGGDITTGMPEQRLAGFQWNSRTSQPSAERMTQIVNALLIKPFR